MTYQKYDTLLAFKAIALMPSLNCTEKQVAAFFIDSYNKKTGRMRSVRSNGIDHPKQIPSDNRSRGERLGKSKILQEEATRRQQSLQQLCAELGAIP